MDKLVLNVTWQLRRANGKPFEMQPETTGEYQIRKSDWKQLRGEPGPEVVEGEIPGSVYSFLLDAGVMRDPFYRDNELWALRLMEEDYVFSRSFTVDEGMLGKPVLLYCAGLDTLAAIEVNGHQIGRANNMHREWYYDLTGMLQTENEIRVTLDSPNRFIEEADDKRHVGYSTDAMRGFPHLRKAHCMFGWDWGARLPDVGIWRDIELIFDPSESIGEVRVTQEHEDGKVRLLVSAKSFEAADALVESKVFSTDAFPARPADLDEMSDYGMFTNAIQVETFDWRISLITPDGEAFALKNDQYFTVVDPELWWPSGLGGQPLYTVRTELLRGQDVLDMREERIGLRRLSIRREEDEWGESFAQECNGQTYFAMGADYIPEDNLLSRVTPERTRRLLEDCVEANFNSVRIWGGGYYPDTFFYDICDELGLVVWQDFMFACANYPLDEAFERNIRVEVRQNARRLRNHASLGLWCGNNEMEDFQVQGAFESDDLTRGEYIKMFEYIIPQALRQEDKQTFYWPASPSSGGSFVEPNAENRGDVHHWAVWHGSEPFTSYRDYYFRYVSEFGFQSFPEMRTIESFTEPEDRNIFSRVMEMHQRNAGANGRILAYLARTYLYPNNFEALVYASQMLQADAIRYGVEHWRRHRGRCMGAIYWQLNDNWPVASWSSIDYFGRWKALHYYAKRFFAPLMISCAETSEGTERTAIVQELSDFDCGVRLSVANESAYEGPAIVRWSLRGVLSEVLAEAEMEVEVKPWESIWLDELTFPGLDYLTTHITYALYVEGEKVSEGTTLFTQPKYYRFADPKLTYEIDDGEIVVTAEAYARGVAIQQGGEGELVLDNNFFDMETGKRRVRILRGTPEHIQLMSVYDIR